MNTALFSYIKECPTAYHAADYAKRALLAAGYTELKEAEAWLVEEGKGYFVVRGGSALIAFVAGGDGYRITASHGDSPALSVKWHKEKLAVEVYGGMIMSSWLDRPLSAAGRITVRTEKGLEARLVDLREPVAIIPNVAIHLDRSVNEGKKINPAVDLQPLGAPLSERIEGDVVDADLILYNPQQGQVIGDLITAPRLDDLQCAFASLTAFLASNQPGNVYVLFDHEEVGSMTRQGAASNFLGDVLDRLGDRARKCAKSFLVSCDNAHAAHPNHMEMADGGEAVTLNGGVVIKHNANRKYTTEGVTSAVFAEICNKAGVPVQHYYNRPDQPGGSTLGAILSNQVSVPMLDIGCPQLAMHSCMETSGAQATQQMVRALTAFYNEKENEYVGI